MPCDIRIRIDQTNIVRIDQSILRRVAEKYAARAKGSVTTQTSEMTVHTPGLPGGVTLHTQGGRLAFEQNSPYQPDYEKMKQELPNAYVDEVIEASLRSQHFSLNRRETANGPEYNATDLAGRQLKILRQKDGKIRFDFGDGFDDAAYHETSDAIKKAMRMLGVEIETTWSQKEDPEKWLEQKIAIIGRDN
jgi:hypothetical protein